MKKLCIFVFLILSLNFAAPATVNADFRWNDPAKYFKTDLSFESKYQLSLVAGKVGAGVNPADIKSNDLVCPGATLRVTPKVDAKFASNNIDIFSATYVGYMSVPTPSPAKSSGDIKWISNSLYTELSPFGDSDWNKVQAGRLISQEHYNALQPFTDEPVTYDGIMLFPNSIGGAKVICVGSFSASDNGNPIGSAIDLSSSGTADFNVNTPGGHNIIGQLNGATCAGALLKYPKEIPGSPGATNPAFYRLYYFKGNSPSVPAAPYNIPINVQSGAGTCKVTKQGLTKDTKTIGTDEYSLVNLAIKNEGTGTVTLNSITDNSATFDVLSSNDPICMTFGFCSPTIIGSQMAPGETKTLYFYAKRKAGKTGDGNFFLTTQVDSGGCGTGDTCSLNFDISTPETACQISPSAISLKANQVGQFSVTCTDKGAPTPCTGDWSWDDATGGFQFKDSNKANATNSASSGTHNLKYTFGTTTCNSAVTMTPDDGGDKKASCKVTGPDLLYSGNTGSYAINCTNDMGAIITCPAVTWGGSASYRSSSNTGAIVEATSVGKFEIDAHATIDAKDVSCIKDFEVLKGKCVYYS